MSASATRADSADAAQPGREVLQADHARPPRARTRRAAARARWCAATPIRENLLAVHQWRRRYQFGDVLGGGTSGVRRARHQHRRLGVGDVLGQRLAERRRRARRRSRPRMPNAPRQRLEVGRVQVDAVALARPPRPGRSAASRSRRRRRSRRSAGSAPAPSSPARRRRTGSRRRRRPRPTGPAPASAAPSAAGNA